MKVYFVIFVHRRRTNQIIHQIRLSQGEGVDDKTIKLNSFCIHPATINYLDNIMSRNSGLMNTNMYLGREYN